MLNTRFKRLRLLTVSAVILGPILLMLTPVLGWFGILTFLAGLILTVVGVVVLAFVLINWAAHTETWLEMKDELDAPIEDGDDD